MNNKQATFNILSQLKSGDEFSGYDLMQNVKMVTGKTLYPSTSLRYLREYRKTNNINTFT